MSNLKILVINQYGHNEIKESKFIPRVGDGVDMFYEPLPKVTAVVAWPSADRLSALGIDTPIDAIVTVR